MRTSNARQKTGTQAVSQGDPLWYKDAIIYQVHVRAFADSDGDGIGDFRGLASRLDYLRDLGVSAIWILPFYPSPLKDDGYDIADYTAVHPDYGTLADFRFFLREAHRRGLKVIIELVLNHTSDQHPWFQRARRAPAGSAFRDFYVWSDTPDLYKETRIIFKDFEASNWTWDSVAGAYFWHRFYHHQPDLNYANPAVVEEVYRAMDFWLDMGVDGLRLDAVPYLFEREGTNCENLPETHQALKALRRHVDEKYRDRMLLAEANQWPEDAVAYFGDGDECHMAFHFPVMPRMFMAIRMEDRYPMIDILAQTPALPATCQWAVFLRNHDELTLEMVTDEERDYMYRVYAHDPRARINLGIRRRLAPLLENNRRRIELMNGLLCSLPGTPVIYYGDEIGMGDNIYLGDRNGVRTPMQWTSDRNAGFSRAPAQRLFLPVIIEPDFHHQAVNVEAQQNNPSSLLWWMRRLIALRKRTKAFGRGSLEFLYPDNHKVLALIRRHEDEAILVVANLSRYAEYVELDMAAWRGMTPVEMFGGTRFPRIGELPYLLTLGPHAFYWFSLEPPEGDDAAPADELKPLPALRVAGEWKAIFTRDNVEALGAVLPRHMKSRRWFAGKARRIHSAEVVDAVGLKGELGGASIALVRVEYTEGDPEVYMMPLAFAAGDRARQLLESSSAEVVARLTAGADEGVLYDALLEEGFCDALLDAIARRRRFKGLKGEIAAKHTRAFRRLRGTEEERLAAAPLKAEQSNSSILYGERLMLKLFRRVDVGLNPDLEVGSFLTEKTPFEHLPPVAGALEYLRPQDESMTLGVLQGYVRNEGDAWNYALNLLGRYFERVASQTVDPRELAPEGLSLIDVASGETPEPAREVIGFALEAARLMGQRTAELHLALASVSADPAFAPEPFTPLYQRSLYQLMRNEAERVMDLLRRRLPSLEADTLQDAREVLDRMDRIDARFQELRSRRITAMRTRIHGDYHLGQVLYTGKDFVILDFEGEPARSVSARRIKRSPLRDVAGMMRSFDYAGRTAMHGEAGRGHLGPEAMALLERWCTVWITWVSAEFLRSYLEVASAGAFLPDDRGELEALLNAYLLEKAIYEVAYELNSRPDWLSRPLRGILRLIGT